mmetsp:Transcript_36353/g.145310  ORF Transcript_36353/g.145310 Transcript_36353/m.145310 type:complete len:331 (-) Transcript_36353:795-1787(-)
MPGRPRKVKSAWDDETDEDDVDSELVADYMANTGLDDDVKNGRKPEYTEDVDEEPFQRYDRYAYEDEDEESGEEEAMNAAEKEFMKDSSSKPVVQGRSSYKPSRTKFSVDAAIENYLEDEFQIASLTMAKRSSGSSSSFGVGKDRSRQVETRESAARYGSASGTREEEVLAQGHKILRWVAGSGDRLIVGHYTGKSKRALGELAEYCGLEYGTLGRGKDSKVFVQRTYETKAISADKMEAIILANEVNPRPKKPREPRDAPYRVSAKKEQQMKKLEETANGVPLEDTNAGHMMLRNMGWSQGSGLGVKKDGRTEPVPVKINVTRKGLGLD